MSVSIDEGCCLARTDGEHCSCWWYGEGCCACGHNISPDNFLYDYDFGEEEPRVPTIKELNAELTEAKLSNDTDRVEAIEERIAIMEESGITK
jgi:hypothetical protein